MSEYIVSARKFRPSTFKSVVGQEALTTTLKNAITSGKLAHAYLFCGPRGVGKTSCARIFAKTINCSNRTPDGEACNQCESCLSFNEQRSYNVYELDAASNNSTDDIRSLIEKVQVAPMKGSYKIYIIDEVHMLSNQAFNAFLKTLEEPPAYALFILATTEKHKVLPTIISRCQTYDFNRISVRDITNHLKYIAEQEGIQAEEEALQRIAIKSDGGLRDALSIFDQVAGYGGGVITLKHVLDNLNLLDESEFFKLLAYIIMGEPTRIMLLIDELIGKGFSPINIMTGFSAFLRNVLLAQDERTVTLIETTDMIRTRYLKAGQTCKPAMIWKCLKLSTDYEGEYRLTPSKRLLLEVTLLTMCESLANSPLSAPITPQNEGGQMRSTPPPTPSAQGNETSAQALSTQRSVEGQSSQSPTSSIQSIETLSVKEYKPKPKSGGSLYDKYRFSLTPKTDDTTKRTEVKKRETPFTEDQLHKAWRSYQATLDKQALLKQTLHDSLPQKLEDARIIVDVYSDQQVAQIRGIEDQLMSFLADKLQNDLITLDIRHIDNKSKPRQLPITVEEKVKFFDDKNEWFTKLRTDLSLRPIS